MRRASGCHQYGTRAHQNLINAPRLRLVGSCVHRYPSRPEPPGTPMKIAACIKRVPTTEAQAKIGTDGKSLDSAGFQYMPSFYDEIAVEEAIKTKEKLGGDVTVLTLGPQAATSELCGFAARGADAGALLVDPAWHARDARSTAKALAKKIGALGAELVF